MKPSIAGIALALALGSAGTTRVHAESKPEDVTKHPGYIDFGTVNVFGKEPPDVEIIIDQALLNFLVPLSQKSDPEFADMVSKLLQIRVQCFKVAPDKLEAIEKKTQEVSGKLESLGWARIVKVLDREENSQTYVYMRMQGNKVQGLAVMSVDPTDKASFVNIVGEIDPEQLGKLESKFDIHGLDSLDLRGTHGGSTRKTSKGK
jgi:hypothetical protein